MIENRDRVTLMMVARAAARARFPDCDPYTLVVRANEIETELYAIVGRAVDETCAVAVTSPSIPTSVPGA